MHTSYGTDELVPIQPSRACTSARVETTIELSHFAGPAGVVRSALT